MRYELAIFDFDGTLADSGERVAVLVNDVAKRFGFRQVTREELDVLRGKDARAVLAYLGVPLTKVPAIFAYARARIAESTHLIRPFPPVPTLLAALARGGVATAIVTSNSEENVRAILGTTTSAHVRHYACGAGLFGKRSKIRDVLRASGIRRERAIAIGDEARDIEAARAAGVAAGAVSWGYATRALLASRAPTVLFDSFEELAGVLLAERT